MRPVREGTWGTNSSSGRGNYRHKPDEHARTLMLRALALRSPSGEPMSCPICSGATRFHKPYLMCDERKRRVGVRINGKAYVSR
jgi:hypothetical protein